MFTRLGKQPTETRLAELMGLLQTLCLETSALRRSSLFLVGGYGRGEGGDHADSSDSVELKNNLDLLLVSTNRILAKIGQSQLRQAIARHNSQIPIEITLSSKSRTRLDHPDQFNFDLRSQSYPIHDGLRLTGRQFKAAQPPPAGESIITLRNRAVLLLMAQDKTLTDGRRRTLIAKFLHGVLDAICLHNGSYTTLINDKEAQLRSEGLRHYFEDQAAYQWFRRAVHHASCHRFYSTKARELDQAATEASARLRPVAMKILSIPPGVDGNALTTLLEKRYAAYPKQTLRTLFKLARARGQPSVAHAGGVSGLSASIIHAAFIDNPPPSELESVCRRFKMLIE